MTAGGRLNGRLLLVVEDEFVLARELATDLEAAGAQVVGPAGDIGQALRLVAVTTGLDGAVVDLNLRGEMAYPLADALIERGIPFVFATGYGEDSIPPRYAAVRRCPKPLELDSIAAALFG